MEGLQKEEFLILPHPEVKTYMQRKTADYDRWLQGMRRLQARFLHRRSPEEVRVNRLAGRRKNGC
jgi:hypothetical protein